MTTKITKCQDEEYHGQMSHGDACAVCGAEMIETQPGHFSLRKPQTVPRVGEGVTYSIGTDRYPATIIAVSKSGKTITIQDDKSNVISGSTQDGSAEWRFEENPDGRVQRATLRADGRYRLSGWKRGGNVSLGGRSCYVDPHF